MTGRRVLLVATLALVGAIAPTAQDQKPLDQAVSTSTAAPESAKKPDVEEQLKTVQAQLAALAQRLPAPSVQDQTERAKAIYSEVFSKAKDQAGPACRAAGGRLLVSVDLQANRATVSCELK